MQINTKIGLVVITLIIMGGLGWSVSRNQRTTTNTPITPTPSNNNAQSETSYQFMGTFNQATASTLQLKGDFVLPGTPAQFGPSQAKTIDFKISDSTKISRTTKTVPKTTNGTFDISNNQTKTSVDNVLLSEMKVDVEKSHPVITVKGTQNNNREYTANSIEYAIIITP